MYNAKDEQFERGELLTAVQLNRLEARISRLEKLSTNNLMGGLSNGGINLALPHNIPEVEFVLTTQEVYANSSILFPGMLLDQDGDANFTTVDTQEIIEFRNIFECSLSAFSRALLIRFPRGNGEWIWIPKACNPIISSSGLL